MLKLGQVSVGAPYFNALFVPLTWLLLLFLAIGPVSRWKRHLSIVRYRSSDFSQLFCVSWVLSYFLVKVLNINIFMSAKIVSMGVSMDGD